MPLDNAINYSIWNYPSLFRVRNNQNLSRLHVLEHMFFTIGTGYEWNKASGELLYHSERPETHIPDEFYQHELYEFTTTKPSEFSAFLKKNGRFHYERDSGEFHVNGHEIIFQATEEEAQNWSWEWNEYRSRPKVKPEDPKDLFVYKQETSPAISLYPLSEYSPLVELVTGHTRSTSVDNYSLDMHPPKKEYIDGCREIAEYAIEYCEEQSMLSEYMRDQISFDLDRQLDYLYAFRKKFGRKA